MRNVVITVGFAVLITSSITSEVDICPISTFLGPSPRTVYVYRGSDGTVIKSEGMSRGPNQTLRVKETVFFHRKNMPAQMPTSVTTEYTLAIEHGQMIRKNGKKAEVVLREPFNDSRNEWCIKGTALKKIANDKAKVQSLKSVCKISEVYKKVCFGKIRCTVSAECVASMGQLTTIRKETYAEGIGLIERVLYSRNTDGRMHEVFRLTLEKIEKKEKH